MYRRSLNNMNDIEQGELIEVNGKTVMYCGEINWLNSENSCNQRVQFLKNTYHVSNFDAKVGLLEKKECICSRGGLSQLKKDDTNLGTANFLNEDGNTYIDNDNPSGGFFMVSLSLFITLIMMICCIRSNRSRRVCHSYDRKGLRFCFLYALGFILILYQGALLQQMNPTALIMDFDHFYMSVGNNAKVGDINQIQIENSFPGTNDWVLTNPALNREVEGYMSRTSIERGQNISLFYSVKGSEQIKVEVFRTGWYNGIGGRKVFGPIDLPGLNQDMPHPGKDGLIVCQWKDPYVLRTEKEWTSGVYLVKMTESTTTFQSYAIFVLRDGVGSGEADIMFQLPVNTYQAYNYWGGKNLYGCRDGKGCKQAQKVSFDRPYAGPENTVAACGTGAGEYLSNVQPLGYPISTAASWNYNMVRWLERNNLSVTYVTNTDVHTRLPTLVKPKMFLTQGHDEYWTWDMRDHVTAWRDEGVHLAFLGSNTAYWQIRYEDIDNSLPGDPEPRTVVCYRRKDPDKSKYMTTKFRQIRPEALMVGLEYVFPLGDPFDSDMIVYDASHWMFNGTGLVKGDKIPGLLGCKYITCVFVCSLSFFASETSVSQNMVPTFT